MKKIVFLCVTMAIMSLSALGQDATSAFDIRNGVSVLKYNKSTVASEMEINYAINRYLTTALAVGIGGSRNPYVSSKPDEFTDVLLFTKAELNIFVSPFRNDSRNDFRIGTGLGLINSAYSYAKYTNQILTNHIYESDKQVVYNIIVEDTFMLTDRFMLGVKAFTHIYGNGGYIGTAFKVGVKL